MGIEVLLKRRRFGFGLGFILYIFVCLMFSTVASNVLLIGQNLTLSFEDMAANFAVPVKNRGECGALHVAKPIDACSPLMNTIVSVEGLCPPYVLVERGRCTFEDKVRTAQSVGFEAAVIYDNIYDGRLVAMAGDSDGIKIHAVFISKASGEYLKKYAGDINMELWIIPSYENSAWSIMAISFISLLAMSAVLATCFFVRRHRIRRDRPRAPSVREFHGMSSRLVKAMPSLIFTAVLEDNCTSMTCAICLEDYSVGERLRVLPCHHKFHAACVDAWLTSWRTFCPVCKRDARTRTGDPPASENTPLLSSSPMSLSSSAALSSFRSSLASSSAIQIAQGSSQSTSLSLSRDYSLPITPFVNHSRRSYNNSPTLNQSRSSVDLRNASSQRSYGSHLLPSQSLGYPSLSPLNSRYISPYLPSSSNASPSYVGSSSRQPYLIHCSESATSISPFASAQSLPGC
ncbi:receptor-like protein [Thalictrum thalictroides]|uniref:Receptor-like protein n=1 Tax=Thalictrum thalictroides TaxID=46969 RepID=A0A7J6W8I1_THATH|nr:receptor-like protein [Thalictrum thalictroides]